MNIERFKTIVERIKADPSCWVQHLWRYCIAGHAQIDAGKDADDDIIYEDAIEWLDLTAVEADWLFAPYRTIEDFEAVIAQGSVYDRDGFDRYGYDRNNKPRQSTHSHR